jgi:hypothetical protein
MFMHNKKFVKTILIFLFIIIASFVYSVVFTKKGSSSQTSQLNPTQSPKTTLANTQSSSTITLREKQEIDNITVSNVQKILSGNNIGVTGLKVFGNYAIETIYSKSPASTTADGEYTTENANVILRKENEKWGIIAGPANYFDQDFLNSLNLPVEVIKEANNTP